MAITAQQERDRISRALARRRQLGMHLPDSSQLMEFHQNRDCIPASISSFSAPTQHEFHKAPIADSSTEAVPPGGHDAYARARKSGVETMGSTRSEPMSLKSG
jgi:hypothetical protein